MYLPDAVVVPQSRCWVLLQVLGIEILSSPSKEPQKANTRYVLFIPVSFLEQFHCRLRGPLQRLHRHSRVGSLPQKLVQSQKRGLGEAASSRQRVDFPLECAYLISVYSAGRGG